MSGPKERPILFSAPMVRAILEGRKTQTRRVVAGQPLWTHLHTREITNPQLLFVRDDRALVELSVRDDWDGASGVLTDDGKLVRCPYGKPGDRLWVRETFCCVHGLGEPSADDLVRYRADDTDGDRVITEVKCWKPSIYMPRVYSRITLELSEVRVQRLQEIDEADAIAEGFEACKDGNPGNGSVFDWYRELWESINGPGSWDANPWVWALTFEVMSNGGNE